MTVFSSHRQFGKSVSLSCFFIMVVASGKSVSNSLCLSLLAVSLVLCQALVVSSVTNTDSLRIYS